jgi:hypothetical protein
MADVQDHTLTPVQGILARSFARYGAVVFDNAGPFGPTFQLNTTSGDPAWSEVATKYGLKTINATLGGVVSEGVLLNLALPLDYMKAHAHAIDACVIRKTC